MKLTLVAVTMAAAAWASPPIACHEFVSTQGSVFAELEPLRRIAMQADDSPAQRAAARERLAELMSKVRPGDPVSLLRAGYWAEVLREIRVAPEADGLPLMLKALALRPGDAEYHFIAALAFAVRDPARFREQWSRANALAPPGSVTARNVEVFGPLVLSTNTPHNAASAR